MRAYVLHGINNLVYEEIAKPVPNKGEVLVKVKTAGICGSDIPRVYRTGAHVHPIVPGHEFAGEVVEAADEAGERYVGKRVGVFPLIPCMKCPQCLAKKYEMCGNYNYLGSRCDGGFAEYVSVPVWNLIELPEAVSYETAAMLEPLSVATHAVRGLLDKNTDRNVSIAVWGQGTVGLMITSILKAEGYNNIFVIVKKDYQSKICEEKIGHEAGRIFDSSDSDICGKIKELNNKKGIDYVFECVGRSETAENCIDIAGPAGNVMLVGNPYSDMTFKRDVYWKILRNELTVKGTWNSSFTGEESDDWHYVTSLLETGRLNVNYLVSHRFGLDEFVRGFEIMRDKSEDYIKCMCVMNEN